MTLLLRRDGQEISSRDIQLAEYEPLEIEVLTGREVRVRPDVLLDGASIGQPEVAIGAEGLRWRWVFRSESWCGRATLTVTSDQLPVDLCIRATPSRTKYSEDEYERMIERVLAFGANLPWGLAPGESAGSEAAQEQLGATHPALIHQYLGPLLEQLARLLPEPVVNHRRVEIVDRLRPTWSVAPRTLAWLASRPDDLHLAQAGSLRVVAFQYLRQESYDHPANRYVLTLVRHLRVAFQRTAQALEAFSNGWLVGDLEKKRATHLAGRVRAGPISCSVYFAIRCSATSTPAR